MSTIDFKPCTAGQILKNPESASLEGLQKARFLGTQTPIPMYVKFTNYVDLMENFITVSALKKVAVQEAAHYQALLVLRERQGSSVSLMKLGEMEQVLSQALLRSQKFKRRLHEGYEDQAEENQALKTAYASLVKTIEDICPTQNLASLMEDLSTDAKPASKERII